MNTNQANLVILYFIIFIVLFIFLAFIAKWIFKIETIVLELKAQRKLLSLIAEKQGVSKDNVDHVIKIADRGA